MITDRVGVFVGQGVLVTLGVRVGLGVHVAVGFRVAVGVQVGIRVAVVIGVAVCAILGAYDSGSRSLQVVRTRNPSPQYSTTTKIANTTRMRV
jgi:hypothetical protein